MSIWQQFLQQIGVNGQGADSSDPERLIGSLVIFIVGLIVLEIIFRLARRRVQASIEKKGQDPRQWRLKGFMPPLRLAAVALLLRLIEPLLPLTPQFIKVLRGIEVLFIVLVAIIVFYLLIAWLDRLRLALPDNLQDQFPENALAKLKSFLRVSVLIAAVVIFLYSSKNFFPEQFFRYPFWRYLLILGVIIILFVALRKISTFLTQMTSVLRSSEENIRLRMILEAAIWPVRLLLAVLALTAVSELLRLSPFWSRIFEMSIGVLSTLALVVFIYRLVELLVYELTNFAQREDNLLDQTFVQMMRMIARIVVVVFGAIYLIRAISGKPLSALLAGLGIGGLAVALAAQDTLKNFFGSIMIMLDKPFSLGQRVVVGGHDGTVEEIGFRSTRVRTLTGHLVSIPNEKVATDSVENIGRRPSIRRLTNITITYDTPLDKVQKAVEILREILANHEGMDPEFPPRVYFNEFNADSLNILMVYWYFPADYWAYLEFTQRVNMEIMRRFEAEGIEFAFPTTTAYLAQDDRRPLHISLAGDSQLVGVSNQSLVKNGK
ncbi:MAG: mechanosensitive ion channel family protein [Desulfobacterales bacterium]|jgi:small-conductance mechanosensitive channel